MAAVYLATQRRGRFNGNASAALTAVLLIETANLRNEFRNTHTR